MRSIVRAHYTSCTGAQDVGEVLGPERQRRGAATISLLEIILRRDNPMTIRFMDIDILKASEGRLPSLLSGYMDRSNGKSATTGESFRWRHRRHDLVFTKVIVPEGVRKAYRRPTFLWAKMERAEIRKTPRRTGKHKLTKSELAALIKQIEAPGPKLLSQEVLAPAWRDDAQLQDGDRLSHRSSAAA